MVGVLTYAQPRLVNNGNFAHLIVNDKPMLIIGGELGNSSASTLDDLKRIFPHLHSLGLNTALVPLSWCLIEPKEGEFDMTSLDNILTEARKNELKIVLLWFGAWKNSMSCYAPDWVKTDTKRFARAHTAIGKPVEETSSLCKNTLSADCRAFCKVMQYLRDHDAEQTVVMVQVENEIGMIESPRDYSADATRMYRSAVPAQLSRYLSQNKETLHPYLKERLKNAPGGKSWGDMFGDDMYGEEIFQAWTYAKYVQHLAQEGRKYYDIPMYVNVALNSRGRTPGQYPSAGPLAHLIDIWHCGAPSIDVLGVDIYDKGFTDWTAKYHLPNNPLFIPEIRLEDKDAMHAIHAFGHHGAMGFCPFSIEDYPLYAAQNATDWRSIDLSADDQLNAYGHASSSLSPISAAYRLLRQVEPMMIERQGTDQIDAVLLDNEHREAEILTPDSVRITIRHSLSLGWEPQAHDSVWPEAACMILRLADDDYIVLGSDVVLTFTDDAATKEWTPGDTRIGILSCQEVEINPNNLITDGNTTTCNASSSNTNVNDDIFVVKRHLSGDQTHQGRHVRIPHGQFAIQRFRLYRY